MPDPLDDPRFNLRPPGRFRDRAGPHGVDAERSSKKLCLVATDPQLLIDTLYGLSLRSDCASVKYGTDVRDGMYLGRVYLATDEAAAELCEAFKGHPRLMASLQDDAFFNRFRAPQRAQGVCSVYEAWPEHAARIAEIHTQAFGRPDEAAIVATITASRVPIISLIAELDREIVGHILLSPVKLEGSEEKRGLGLAPLAVVPQYWRRGIGEQLVHAGLERARLFGYDYAVVLGEPRYYARFGFTAASRFGLRSEYPAPDAAFMAIELHGGVLHDARGLVLYVPALRAL